MREIRQSGLAGGKAENNRPPYPDVETRPIREAASDKSRQSRWLANQAQDLRIFSYAGCGESGGVSGGGAAGRHIGVPHVGHLSLVIMYSR
jgi:hypothetical protein